MTYKSLIVIVILLVGGLVFWQVGCNKPPQKVQEEPTAIYNKTIDSLKTLIADQAVLQQGYTAQINELNDSIIVLNDIIQKNTLTINQIKARRNEKVNAVSKFSSDDITKFLSNRYKDSIR